MKERWRPRLDISDPSRFARMEALWKNEPLPVAARDWGEAVPVVLVFAAMVAGAAYIGLTALGAW